LSRGLATLGLRNSLRRRKVLGLTLISIALSVSLLYTAVSASASLEHSANLFLKESLSPLDLRIHSTKWGKPISYDTWSSISRLPDVEQVFPRIEEYAWIENETSTVYVRFIAIDAVAESNVGSLNATQGTVELSFDACFLTLDAKEALETGVGEQLRLLTSAGLEYFNVTGCGLAIDKGVFGPIVFISLERAWDVYRIRYPDHSINRLYIELKDVFTSESVTDSLSVSLGEDYAVFNLKTYQIGVASVFLGQARTILFALVASACFVSVFRVFSSFAAVFGERRYETGILLAFGSSRKQVVSILLSEIGAVGLAGAALGAILGVGLAYIVLNTLVLILRISVVSQGSGMFSSAFSVDPISVAVASLAGIGLTLAAGAVPAVRAASEPVASSLSSGMPKFGSGRQFISLQMRRRLQGLLYVLSVVAFLPLAVQLISEDLGLRLLSEDWIRVASIPVMLLIVAALSPKLSSIRELMRIVTLRSEETVRYLSMRNLRRNTVTAIVVFNLFAASTVLFMASTNVNHVISYSWQSNMQGQTAVANILAYAESPKGVDTVNDMRGLKSVVSAVGMNQVIENTMMGQTIVLSLVIGTETLDFGRLASVSIIRSINESLDFGLLEVPSTCVISDYAARTYSLDLGSWVLTSSGANLTVVGICSSSIPIYVVAAIEPVFVIMGPESWAGHYGVGNFEVTTVLIESSNVTQTMTEFAAFAGIRTVIVSALQTDYASALQMIDVVVNTSLLVLFATTVFSTLLTSMSVVTARTRETGLLRAMGLSEREIAKAVTMETSISMLAGVGVGVLAGLVVEIAMADIVTRFSGGVFYVIDAKTVILILVSLVSSLVAMYWGTKRACRSRTISLLHDTARGH